MPFIKKKKKDGTGISYTEKNQWSLVQVLSYAQVFDHLFLTMLILGNLTGYGKRSLYYINTRLMSIENSVYYRNLDDIILLLIFFLFHF